MPLPPQDELRRRLRAARLLADMTIVELAQRLPAEAQLGERVLRKLENGETMLKPQILRELANALAFPYEWFTVADLRDSLVPNRVDERLVRLERDFTQRLAELEKRIASADGESAQSDSAARRRRAPRSSRPRH
jgi:transcriptional regulator with XRE-family HTH domain